MKKILALVCAVTLKISATVQPFPEIQHATWGPVIVQFEEMCRNIKSAHSKLHNSTFISYAWPRDPNLHPEDYIFHQWIQKIQEYLNLAGIQTFFDVSRDGGFNASGDAQRFMENINLADNVLCILTPSFKEKVDQATTFLKQEADMVYTRHSRSVFYIGLSENISSVKPAGFLGLENRIIYPFHARFFQDGCVDGPDINYFLERICDLLKPTNKCLFSQLSVDQRHNITSIIDDFIKSKDEFIIQNERLLSDYRGLIYSRYPEIAMRKIRPQINPPVGNVTQQVPVTGMVLPQLPQNVTVGSGIVYQVIHGGTVTQNF